MSDKYYSPEIEEFHVGFEYEYRKSEHHDFDEVACDLEVDPIDKLRDDIKNNLIRVKYLDREDIEECGFEFVEDDSVGDGNQRWYDLFTKDNYSLSSWYNIDGYESLSNKVKIMKKDNILFDGYLKNKSEFKKILKQVGITK